MHTTTGKLFTDTTPPLEGEHLQTLLSLRNLRIERIVSSAKAVGTRYQQSQDEWVALLAGSATLRVHEDSVELCAGDYLFLPANTPHTVTRVSAGAIWLAIHLH